MKRDRPGLHAWMGLRARLWLVMLVVLLPGSAYIITTSVLEHQRARQQAQADLLSLVRLISNEEKQSIDAMQRSLALVASLGPVQGLWQGNQSTIEPSSTSFVGVCRDRLSQVARQFPSTTGFDVWNLTGALVCPSALPEQPSAADESWFRQVIVSDAFTIGDFELSSARPQPVLTFGYPITNSTGQFAGVVSSGLDLAQLTQTASVVALPADAVVTVFDHGGVILARSVDPATWDGKTLPDAAGLASVLSNGANVMERADVDGVTRVSAFAPVPGPGGNLVYLSIGRPVLAVDVPTDTALAVGLAITAGLTVLAVALAALWSRQTLVGPLQGLLAATDRITQGDLTARARLEAAGSEVDRLGNFINATAATLERREKERQVFDQKLREQEGRLQQTQAHAAQLEAVAAGLSKASTPAEVCEVILRQGASAVGAVSATLLLLTEDGAWLKQAAHIGPLDPIDRLFQQYPVSSPLPAADVVRTGLAVWIESAAAYRARYPQLSAVIDATDYEAALAMPLRQGDRLMGVLSLSFLGEMSDTGEIDTYLATLATFCALGLERARLYAESHASDAIIPR